ncbi:hypothetical protein SERLA73DRAFT_158671 [Serpula lacrymans var. lacrymans S7.3]|uniref:Ras GEF n=2 Tax=Serpula lacrymans var. lacrymans TaxID=341189 RepID=F8PN18_SERL3|nr:uncharacterized protein SERLADRAFT_446094 [Serpula lacrymans var. lacrymans S7.9]EGO03000.1 hypothetical protein SERLA73DRAFT_158671 [Serpula lacrymans var. lacrymans S7.3]EGO28680.1 hypothetical protein SERLADRAFT_446094 [Serpula lacrymans var. lacrymans S7.9]
MPDMTAGNEQESCPTTPVVTHPVTSLAIPPKFSDDDQHTPNALPSSSNSVPTNEPHHGQLLVPILASSTNSSQSSFAFSSAIPGAENEWHGLNELPPEIATADISIAPDGSFVETSSGLAARELKRRYDQHLGVGRDVRSPYAITAFVNQHGKQMYRVGHRDLSAPAASAAEVSNRVAKVAPPTTQQDRPKRRSRMSVHTLLSQGKLKNGGVPQPVRPLTELEQNPGTLSNTPRKLRKTRSIPDMFGLATGSASTSNTMGGKQGQAPVTGRTHSHSVTGADMPRLPPTIVDMPKHPSGDIFADVMNWHGSSVPPSPYTSSSVLESPSLSSGDGSYNPYDEGSSAPFISHPFGTGISFDSPMRRQTPEYLPMPHALREMQSFESGLTARAGDTTRREKSPDLTVDFDGPGRSSSPGGPPRLAVSPLMNEAEHPEPDLIPLPETSMHSQYSTEVFDVLQSYRGLPLLDRLFPESGETTIKLSLRADDSAAPRDDPRFVLWGEMHKDIDGDDHSVSHDSRTGLSSPVLSASRRGTRAGRSSMAPEPPSVRISSGENTKRALLAATIERWIAQLTSELNYEELLNFFLTYRTYISAVDLCHLLICRFHWALSSHSSKQYEDVRRIVRVRTFVAIRYWLLTFFVVDFLPNRELRLLLADWLNALVRDPILKKHQGALSIVRKLIKVAKDCKEAHTRRRRSSVSRSLSISGNAKPTRTHVLGEKFAQAISKDEDEDSDVDLDFVPDDTSAPGPSSVFQGDSVNPYSFGGQMSPPRPLAVSSASAAILHQPLQVNILQQSRATSSTSAPTPDPQLVQNAPPTPLSHNVLSRAFVKTIGRLGRWKRVLNSRPTVQTALAVPANVSAFDLELNATGDLLTVRGGVEQYLRMIEPPSPATPVNAPSTNVYKGDPPSSNPKPEERSVSTDSTLAEPYDPEAGDTKSEHAPSQHLRSVTEVTEEDNAGTVSTTEIASVKELPRPESSASAARSSLWSHSTDSFGSILSSRSKVNPFVAQVQEQPPWQFEVVSIDELELSDTSSDVQEDRPPAPGLRKVLRKLPLRRDFEFVRRSISSVSSMGFRSHDSVTSESSALSSVSVGAGLGSNIQQWQVNALVDSLSDDEEVGDVGDALKRLEGQINPQKRKEKAMKVDGWVRTMQERLAAGDYGNERPRFFDDDDEDEDDEDFEIDQHETGSTIWNGDSEGDVATTVQSPGSRNTESYLSSVATLTSLAPIANSNANIAPAVPAPTSPLGDPEDTVPPSPSPMRAADPTSPHRVSDAKPAPEDAVPLEILQSRVPSRPSTSHGSPSHPINSSSVATMTSPSSKILASSARSLHKSWILNFRAEVLVQHFSIIDRELFLGVKAEELILEDWKSCQEVNVLDWAQYLKDRARWKAESRWVHKTSALGAVRARFNLIANFTTSEIVLTHPNDRGVLVGKFIRIAFKAYVLSNFNTLVAILAGLRSEWATRAMHRHWNRVGIWETQMLNKLTQFTTSADYFKAMHEAISAMIDAKPMNISSHTSSVVSGSATDGQSSKSKATSDSKTPTACIPFIGVYLSQLYRYSRLPDLIDPTAPHDVVGLDPHTANFDSPAHPDVFDSLTPLPPSMQLEPLINVHKQRLIAGVIKDLVAGQHLASRIQHPIDKKLFQKCLKLRGLEPDTLQRAFGMYPERDTFY